MSNARIPVSLTVNGRRRELLVEPRRTLLEALRLDLGLTGAKQVCNMGDCGACTVILDGKPVYSCLTLAVACADRTVETVEGLAKPPAPGAAQPELHPVQEAFIACDAFQCGFCTPGQIMSVKALLDANPNPGPEEIRRAVSGNLCRCGAYPRIFAAAEAAAARLRQGVGGDA